MELDLDPAWRVLDRGPQVVGTPAFHKTHLEDAETPEVVDSDARRRRQA